MSSKTKTTATKEEAKAALVPKLRFPEFQDAVGWKMSCFDEVLSPVVRERPKPADAYLGLGLRSHGKGTFLKPLADPAKNSMDQLYEVKTNDLIVNITFAWEGAVAIAQDCDEGALVSHRFPTYTFEKGRTTPDFFRYIILDKQFIYNLGVISPGGAGRNRVMSKNDFLKLRVALPSPAEQQKIAECLSSVDELMAAQARKVDALKTHKKGLMQQLFPREGETQPRLRFPEFQNAGEWVCEELSSCLKKVIDYRGIAPPKSESGVPLITAKNVRFGWLDMTNDEYIEQDKYEEWMSRGIPQAGDILFTTEAPLGNVALFPPSGKFALGQRLLTLRSKPERCVPAFLFHSLLGPTMQAEIDFHGTGSTAKGIKSKVFVKLNFCHPGVQEQQRIADCLTSLDALITAETQKHEALKTHKKGLMQQLFPSPEEVEA